jgi:5'-3' exoribonuclease 2
MGVPGFFMWLLKQYKNKQFVFPKSKADVNSTIHCIDYIMIDCNCMIHPECFKTLEDISTTDITKIEAKMRNNIILYLEKIIENVKPVKGVYIAIDGVAPVAKMKQQRFRRYKSINDKNLHDRLRSKYNKENPFFWNNSAITPGTDFMKLLDIVIKEWATNYSKKNKLEIIYSSCNVPGEGEHKLLQYIRNNKQLYNYVIYGLDADLIFLALSTGLDNIYLMREGKILNSNKEETNGFNFVSIKIMKECIIDSMIKILKKNEFTNFDDIKLVNTFTNFDDIKLVNDFIFICYLMGNDFLPHLPSLNIYEGAIDTLIEKYILTIIESNKYICDNNSINTDVFYNFVNKIALNEEETLKEYYHKKKRTFPCSSNEPYDIEVHRIDNMMFKVNDPIKLGSDNMTEWRERYYNHYYNVGKDELEEFVKKMTYHYIRGLKWVTSYYFDKCCDWDWFYPYDHPPFLTDINNFKYNFNDIKFTLGEPMSPFEQLLTVLPKQSSYLLPEILQKIMLNCNSSLAHLYPSNFELDMIGKKKYWMVQPILPDMEINLIRQIFTKYYIKLPSYIKEMNNIRDIIIYK